MAGTILNPGGRNCFKEMYESRDRSIFVDKTAFLAEIICRMNSLDKLIAFIRPRRFGKTLTARMLASFFSRGDDCREMFANLKIAAFSPDREVDGITLPADWGTYLNQSDVIYWDMISLMDGFRACQRYRANQAECVADIVDYMEQATLAEIRTDPRLDARIRESSSDATGSLRQALLASGSTFVLIMDEWDLLFRDHRDDLALQQKFIDFLKGLFKSSDGLSCFSLVYLTGILPIKKYRSQSALNNFREHTLLTPGGFAPYFGFTDEEVAAICQSPRCRIPRVILKQWYEGYRILLREEWQTAGTDDPNPRRCQIYTDVYNPNSVCCAVMRNECLPYWSDTSSDEELVRLISMNFAGLKDDVLNLIAGARVDFDFRTFQNDMVTIENKDQVFSLLVCLGYLGCTEKGGTRRSAYVPNKEIRSALSSLVRVQSWYGSMAIINRSEKLFSAICTLDSETTAGIIREIHDSSYVSKLGYNSEETLVFCLIAGLMWSTEADYDCYRELPAGLGFADLVLVPKCRTDLPVLVMEFKRDFSAEKALAQIREKNYASRYCSDLDSRQVILIGLGYDSRTKEHCCVMERQG